MIAAVLSGGLLAIAFATDIVQQKIPNRITAAGLIIGIVLHIATEGYSGASFALIGALLGFIPLLLLYWIHAVGAGDVKLFAALGALTGAEFVLQSIMYSLVYAACISCLILLWRWEWKRRGVLIARMLLLFFLWKDTKQLKGFAKSSQNFRFPFMWAVLPAAATAAYLQIS
ncbi:A24 family peptidase [Paenibacillus radicis (ex Xue et al. 2023)]|uniref:A24 family peptidase n=1 Tax=Paenibacillus radicis (ex Xue et al. 2023) TaxID=2972489 RepID=A0ABT1YHG3_9BACL|nr:A24 family peptidase [Paenibacillus radicis (ex Xue et al. 2023)]MCR8631859.1 A24 family peptidase [Paenibacillus radicis (ex Xue et al. 2023)]